jgi:glutathione S-transferase
MVSIRFSITLPMVHQFQVFLARMRSSLDMYVAVKRLLKSYYVLLRLFSHSEYLLLINVQVVEWLEYAPTFFSASEFENACSFVDGYLGSRTFLAGHGLTIADLTVWSNIAGELWVFLIFFFQFYPELCNVYLIVSFLQVLVNDGIA